VSKMWRAVFALDLTVLFLALGPLLLLVLAAAPRLAAAVQGRGTAGAGGSQDTEEEDATRVYGYTEGNNLDAVSDPGDGCGKCVRAHFEGTVRTLCKGREENATSVFGYSTRE